MNQLVYKILFVLLTLSLVSAKIEASFLVGSVALLLSFCPKISSGLMNIILLFLLLNIIGIWGIVRTDNLIGVFAKDFIYFSRPIIVVLASYSLIKRIKNKDFIFNSIILLSFAFASWHIIKLLLNFSFITESITITRRIGGRYNHLELVALIFLVLKKNHNLKNYIGKLNYRLIFFFILLSFILYFSRVMIAVFILFILAYKGYFTVTKKGLIIIFLGPLLLATFMYTVNKFDVDSNSEGFGGFIFKVQNSYDEIFETLDIDKIKLDKRDLWKHWRGYEAQTAIGILNADGMISWAIGKGFGAVVDLGVEVQLSGEEVRFIPILHNGFVYVLFKTGFLGLIIYLIYIFYLYSFYREKSQDVDVFQLNRMLVGCCFYVLLSSLVVTGIFKPYDFSSVLVGGIFALKSYYIENRNIRH